MHTLIHFSPPIPSEEDWTLDPVSKLYFIEGGFLLPAGQREWLPKGLLIKGLTDGQLFFSNTWDSCTQVTMNEPYCSQELSYYLFHVCSTGSTLLWIRLTVTWCKWNWKTTNLSSFAVSCVHRAIPVPVPFWLLLLVTITLPGQMTEQPPIWLKSMPVLYCWNALICVQKVSIFGDKMGLRSSLVLCGMSLVFPSSKYVGVCVCMCVFCVSRWNWHGILNNLFSVLTGVSLGGSELNPNHNGSDIMSKWHHAFIRVNIPAATPGPINHFSIVKCVYRLLSKVLTKQ